MPERDLATKALEVRQRRRRNVVAPAAATVVVVTLLAATVGLRALPTQPRAAARPDAPPELTTIRVGVMPTAERGSLDLAQTDYLTVMARNAARERVKVVASMYRAAPGSFAIVVDAKSKIRTAEDLKGKKVAVPNLMVLQTLMLEAVLKQAGLERKNVRRIEITYPMMLDALKSGRVDAAVLAEPFVTLARESRRTRVLEDPATRQLAGLHTAGMAASDEWIGANPRTLAVRCPAT
ncbi:ABC transporter substrate-binding protein [Nonomuraea sp. AD125B]|uniref:ABC transporter substrate-binding protein n=1 Tax=Nonomuraea sp. AD125B TaxID=3242897 RepID=UPI003527764F